MTGKKRKRRYQVPEGSPKDPRETRGSSSTTVVRASPSAFWLYGAHAARAALANPRRRVRRALVSERMAAEFAKPLGNFPSEVAGPDVIGRMLPPGSVHQGVALLCEPLTGLDLE